LFPGDSVIAPVREAQGRESPRKTERGKHIGKERGKPNPTNKPRRKLLVPCPLHTGLLEKASGFEFRETEGKQVCLIDTRRQHPQ
jgi:hypothetical protein